MRRITQNASPALSPSNSYGDPPNAKAIPRMIFFESSERNKEMVVGRRIRKGQMVRRKESWFVEENMPVQRLIYSSISSLKFGGLVGLHKGS